VIQATARIDRARRLAASPEAAWAFLLDIPRWAALFPHVDSVVPYPAGGDNAYLWTMEPLGPPGRKAVTVYACRYVTDDATRTLTWSPVEGVGTGAFSGVCTLAAAPDGGTDGTMEMDAELQIPAPRFLRTVIAPFVQLEMNRPTDPSLERLDAAIPA